MEIDIDRLALLARIKLNSQEKDKLKQEFEGILGFIAQLSEVDTSSIDGPKAGRVVELENVMRDDDSDDFNVSGEQTEVLLKEAPIVQKGFVKVKNVFNK